MNDDRDMQVRHVRILVLCILSIPFICTVASAQSGHGRAGGSTQGSLAVTVTVVPSVRLDMDSDDRQEVIIANSADSKDSFSHAVEPLKTKTAARYAKKSLAEQVKRGSEGMSLAQTPANQSEAAAQFSFPAPKQVEVKAAMVVMDVSEAGKTKREPVRVTTVVPL